MKRFKELRLSQFLHYCLLIRAILNLLPKRTEQKLPPCSIRVQKPMVKNHEQDCSLLVTKHN